MTVFFLRVWGWKGGSLVKVWGRGGGLKTSSYSVN
jgi:hypothetical protein